MSIRENAIVRLQRKLPTHSPAEIEAMVDKMIAEVRGNAEPSNESEFKQKVKRKAGI